MRSRRKKQDYYDILKEANAILSHVNGVSDTVLPNYLEPYKNSLQCLANTKDADGLFIFEKTDKVSILKNISKKEFKKLAESFAKAAKKMVNLNQFMDIFLKCTQIQSENQLKQLVYIIGLMDLFMEFSKKSGKPYIHWDNVSLSIMNSFVDSTQRSEFGIANKLVLKDEIVARAVSPKALSMVLFYSV